MSNTVAVDCWLLSSGVSSFTSTSKLYFPANFSRKPRFGSNTIRASATTNGSSEGVIYKALLCGRRALLSMITLPLVMPCERIDNSVGAIAADESFQVREEIRKVLSKSKAAGVLRLVFHDAGNTKDNSLALGDLIKTFSGGSDLESDILQIEELIRQCFPLDIYTYNLLLRKLTISEMDLACSYFERLCKKGYEPNRWTYDILVHGFLKVGRSSEARRWMEEMFSKGFDLTEATKSFV